MTLVFFVFNNMHEFSLPIPIATTHCAPAARRRKSFPPAINQRPVFSRAVAALIKLNAFGTGDAY
jgi:hypothetical protein